jgi:hypothetical protein
MVMLIRRPFPPQYITFFQVGEYFNNGTAGQAGIFLNIVINIDIALMVHNQFVNFQQKFANNEYALRATSTSSRLLSRQIYQERTLLKASHRFFSLIRLTKSLFNGAHHGIGTNQAVHMR